MPDTMAQSKNTGTRENTRKRIAPLTLAQSILFKEYMKKQQGATIEVVDSIAAHTEGLREVLKLADEMYGTSTDNVRQYQVGARVLDAIDTWLQNGQHGLCDFLLSELEPDRLSSKLISLILTVTFEARDQLPSWPSCRDRCRASLAIRLGEAYTQRLFDPLETPKS